MWQKSQLLAASSSVAIAGVVDDGSRNSLVPAQSPGLVGTLGSRRRAALRRAENLAGELQQANIELARLVKTERQLRILEETDRLHREFLANLSHELRTPLASIFTGGDHAPARTVAS